MGSLAPNIPSPRPFQNVAVFGAGGNLGPEVVSALLDSGFTVTIFSRAESSFKPPPNIAAAVTFRKLEFSETSLSQGLRGQDAVVATVAKEREAILSQRLIIDAAVRAGVRRFVPTEFGSYTEDPAVVERLPIFKGKLAVLDYLKQVSAANLHFSYTAICNGAFFDWGLTSTFLGFQLASRHAILYSNGLTTINATTLPTIGRAVANALLYPASETANRFFCIAEVRTRQVDILTALERETGGKRWDVEGRDAEAVRIEGLRVLKAGGGEGAGMLILGDLYGEGVGTVGEDRVRVDNEVLGVEMREVGNVVREVLSGCLNRSCH